MSNPRLLRCMTFLFLVIFGRAMSAQAQATPGAAEPSSPSQWYGEGVRPTDARTPDQELAGFHLSPGYTVELVASEPQIDKPLNMAFDPQGRLWVTNTLEYPYPAPSGQTPRDSIKILEDRDQDGSFETVITFADKLNIPIGLLPIDDGVIVFSIPFIWKLSDNDGDGVCDHREKLLGPFDTTRDTHGLVNAMRMGDDGWVYACHGFNNQSTVCGTDGHCITMHSGNTFRFLPDGSRVEHVTHGQVNPFGMTVDAWGNRFAADCHSKPITQLLRGGYYSSFGRPDDGLGLVPPMMDHLHGSTAISGIEILSGEILSSETSDPVSDHPSEMFISGNVMTSRINRNAIVRNGATYKAVEMPDFMTSDDPWFRPVDIRQGPDGAFYVADFYNKIIGHYEVPLEHPDRDRFRGRIWRIRRTAAQVETAVDLPDPIDADIAGLGADNKTLRNAALTRIVSLDPDSIAEELHRNLAESPMASIRVGCLWALQRHRRLADTELIAALQDESPLVRVHAAQVGRERESISAEVLTFARGLLDDGEALAVLRAAELLGLHGDASDIERLLSRLATVEPSDTILRQGFRIAIRDLLQRPAIADSIILSPLLIDSPYADSLASILLGLPTDQAGNWLLEYLSHDQRNPSEHPSAIRHIAEYADDESVARLIELVKADASAWNIRRHVFSVLWDQRKDQSTPGRWTLLTWARELAAEKLTQVNIEIENRSIPVVSWHAIPEDIWPWQTRSATDGENDHRYYSSFMLGEPYVGGLSSGPFAAPAKLSFWIVGHDGFPNQPAKGKNFVRLVLDSTGQTIATAPTPRGDIAQQVFWDLTQWQDQSVHLECVDGDDATAYAWIAIGRFDYPPLNAAGLSNGLTDLLELITQAGLTETNPQLEWLADHRGLSVSSRLRVLQTLAVANDNPAAASLAAVLLHFNAAPELSDVLQLAITNNNLDAAATTIIKQTAMKLTLSEQTKLAGLLAKERRTSGWLMNGLRETTLSTEVLRSDEVVQSIEVLATDEQRVEIAEMLAALPPLDVKLNEFKSQLASKYAVQPGNAVTGEKMFEQHCAACHQLGGKGSLVGPQLDGAIVRGIDRLLEDIVTPDLNVDQAFRTTTVLLHDGTVRVGLIRNESTEKLEIVDQQGKVFLIDVAEIETRVNGIRSLMPSGLAESIGEQGIRDLLSYLKSKCE